MYAVLVWSLTCLRSGVFPSVRDDGTPFTDSTNVGDGWRAKMAKTPLGLLAGVIQSRGDWSWDKSSLGVCGWAGEGPAKRCCWKCPANFTDFNFADFSIFALWRPIRFVLQDFMRDCLLNNKPVSMLFQLPGFLFEYISGDLMHCGDLGVLQYLLGNVIHELFLSMGGRIKTPEPILADIMILIKQASKALGRERPPLNKITYGMVAKPNAPKLKCKAAEARGLLECIQFILEKDNAPRRRPCPHAVAMCDTHAYDVS